MRKAGPPIRPLDLSTWQATHCRGSGTDHTLLGRAPDPTPRGPPGCAGAAGREFCAPDAVVIHGMPTGKAAIQRKTGK